MHTSRSPLEMHDRQILAIVFFGLRYAVDRDLHDNEADGFGGVDGTPGLAFR